MTRTRVVVAGLGDSGLLVARHLDPRRFEVVGVSAKPMLVSGQELGHRLAEPHVWARDYLVGFDRYKRLDDVRVVHAELTGLDLGRREVVVRRPDGSSATEPYDVLVVSTGVRNGFWRQPGLQTREQVEAAVLADHERLAAASSVAVVGGGAAAVSTAANLARVFPDHRVDLYFPGERPLPAHHGKVWAHLAGRLDELGVGLHPGHRAVVPDGFDCDAITSDPVAWSTGQPDAVADAVVWAIGRVRPNTDWLPRELLDDDGFVRVDEHLRVPGADGVWSVGDVAASDPLRSSARNRADKLVARNIAAAAAGKPLRTFRWTTRRWGAVIGIQPEGVDIYFASGQRMRFPGWTARRVMIDLITRPVIYGGMREREGLTRR